jgi:hypothetical protein
VRAHRLLGAVLLVAATLVVRHGVARAHSAGVSGFSGQQEQTCNHCHYGGTSPTVTLDGPSTLAPGAAGDYTLTIRGGAAVVGGLDVSVDDAGASLVPVSPDTRRVRTTGFDEVIHTAPSSFAADGTLRFRFRLVAPSAAGALTLFAAGNSCHRRRTSCRRRTA